VPDGMHIGDFIHEVEDDSEGIGDSSCDQHYQGGGADVVQQDSEEEDDIPSHEQINDQRQPSQFSEDGFYQDADDSQSPDKTEDEPALGTFQDEQGVWGVGSGDQEVDADMIENLEHAFQAMSPDQVINRRAVVENDQRRAEDHAADDGGGIAIVGRPHAQHHQGDDAEDGSHQMADAIGPLFASGTVKFFAPTQNPLA